MIRVKVRMIRVGQLRTRMAWDELGIKYKFEDFMDFGMDFEVEMVGKG